MTAYDKRLHAFRPDLADARLKGQVTADRFVAGRPARIVAPVADMNNVTTDGFAGSITAALFLRRFVEKAKDWAHFDIFAWNPSDRPHGPTGGEAQGIRALEQVISQRYG